MFRSGRSFAALEAKATAAGGNLSVLKTDVRGLTQGEQLKIRRQLLEFLQYNPNHPLATKLLAESTQGRLRSFASFHRNDRLYQLPQQWRAGPGGPPPILR
jgi:hypothetical protein